MLPPTGRKGTYQVEVLGDGPSGTVVLACCRFIGTTAPLAFEQLRSEPSRDLRQLRSELVQAIQAQRRAVGARAWKTRRPDAIASGTAWIRSRLQAHESPHRQPGRARQERGPDPSLVLENILCGRDMRRSSPGPSPPSSRT